MRSELEAFNEKRKLAIPLGIHIGINSGEVLSVLKGVVEYAIGDLKPLMVGAGQFAQLVGGALQAAAMSADQIKGIEDELPFKGLNPTEVPGQADAPATPPAEPVVEKPTTPPEPQKSGFMDDIMAKLREILGMEIGAMTVGGVTYQKLVIQPQFKLGDLKLGLYLPMIYQRNMFGFTEPDNYYLPGGNNEWSFGVDKAMAGLPWYDIALDAAGDTLLKIRYVEWGSQRDPFFFKVGNLNDITVGHGLIMRNFANDAEFPTVRRVGLNLGLDFGGIGMEAMTNDAAAPDIAGGRLYVRPIPGYKGALGLTVIADVNPSKGFSYTPVATEYTADDTGKPIFFNPGIDLDLPFVESDPFSIIAFADVAGMIPYFQSAPNTALTGGTPIAPGFAWNAMLSSGSMPKNYGAAAGLFGNILFIDWRLEYRYFTGTFKPAFYDTLYERSRAQHVLDVLQYLGNTADPAYNKLEMGVYGEGGFTLDKIMSLTFGYFWPWALDTAGNIVPGDSDHLLLKFTLAKGVIPVVNIWGSISYERNKFAQMLMGGSGFSLFDANTVVKAEVQYPVAPTLDVVLYYTTTARLDQNGQPVYESASSLLPVLDTNLGIETRVHF